MRYSKFLLLLFLLLNSCYIFFDTKTFKKERQTVRFSMDYRPNIDGKLHMNGAYINGYWGYIFYPDGTYTAICYDSISATVKDSIKGTSGIYSIIGDTVVLDGYMTNGYGEWTMFKNIYIIKNPDTLNFIAYEDWRGEVVHLKDPDKRIKYFVPISESELPSQFELKIRGKKWMWENKADWKAYKKQLDEYLEQKKAKQRALRDEEADGVGNVKSDELKN